MLIPDETPIPPADPPPILPLSAMLNPPIPTPPPTPRRSIACCWRIIFCISSAFTWRLANKSASDNLVSFVAEAEILEDWNKSPSKPPPWPPIIS
ncbi:unnamed protein product [Pseudo-nitzschia multistriata]|uniref:Uncharacterized protein n=1 Tax=Pseudo-nitzschia multistriata TaxID=183589 RepID=A0A448ZIL2_9STRA|nr:unnamed protein product [Pseudo-nitzschia multistriata]